MLYLISVDYQTTVFCSYAYCFAAHLTGQSDPCLIRAPVMAQNLQLLAMVEATNALRRQIGDLESINVHTDIVQRRVLNLCGGLQELARDVIATIRPATMEHHPSGWLARNVLDIEWGAVEAKPSKAAMACELREGALKPYMKAVEAGDRVPGSCMFPLAVMAC